MKQHTQDEPEHILVNTIANISLASSHLGLPDVSRTIRKSLGNCATSVPVLFADALATPIQSHVSEYNRKHIRTNRGRRKTKKVQLSICSDFV